MGSLNPSEGDEQVQWRIAVCEPYEPCSWHECPAATDWEAFLAAAGEMPSGEVYAHSQATNQGMCLVFDEEQGLLLHFGSAALQRIVFPNRPSPPTELADWVGIHPRDLLQSEGYSRTEAFGLMRLFLFTEELPVAVPQPADHPRLPGMGDTVRPNGWWEVVWVPAGEW